MEECPEIRRLPRSPFVDSRTLRQTPAVIALGDDSPGVGQVRVGNLLKVFAMTVGLACAALVGCSSSDGSSGASDPTVKSTSAVRDDPQTTQTTARPADPPAEEFSGTFEDGDEKYPSTWTVRVVRTDLPCSIKRLNAVDVTATLDCLHATLTPTGSEFGAKSDEVAIAGQMRVFTSVMNTKEVNTSNFCHWDICRINGTLVGGMGGPGTSDGATEIIPEGTDIEMTFGTFPINTESLDGYYLVVATTPEFENGTSKAILIVPLNEGDPIPPLSAVAEPLNQHF